MKTIHDKKEIPENFKHLGSLMLRDDKGAYQVSMWYEDWDSENDLILLDQTRRYKESHN